MVSKPDDLAISQAVLDAAVDAIVVADSVGTIINVNAATLALFGYRSRELIGQNVRILTPDDIAVQHDNFIAHHIETGEKKIIGIGRDVEAKRRDGSIFPIHLSIGRAEISGDLSFVGIIHDLTRRRKYEEIEARTQRMDAIGQLTGGVAHDFNNLLTVVIGNLELLDARLEDETQKELLADALEAAELGADLTSRLLGLSRRDTPQICAINVTEAALSLHQLLKRTIDPHIDLKVELAPDVWEFFADPSALQTALLNLVLNAKDAMPSGGQLVISSENARIDDPFIESETGIAAGDYVKISVSDTGIGMDEETRRRAFEPFYTTKPEGKGTGFGLSMVYAFVKDAQGHVMLYSEPGQGSTFSLYFPAAQISGPEVSAPINPVKATGHGERVLVVEDNDVVRKLTVARLTELGYSVRHAENGDEALKILRAGTEIDLLFTDVVMPGSYSGFALAQVVCDEFPTVKILLTSGYSAGQMLENGGDVKRFPMLRKPFRQAELAGMMQSILKVT